MLIAGREVHPACGLFPPMVGAEFDELVTSIRKNGLRTEITLYEGRVLDGRNRLAACDQAGVEPRFKEWDQAGSPWDYAWDMNAGRRHLPADQKVALRLKCLAASGEWQRQQEQLLVAANEARSKATKRRPRVNGGRRLGGKSSATVHTTREPQPHTKAALAAEAGVSPRTAQAVITIQKTAPDLFERVAAGELSAKKALAEVKSRKKEATAQAIRAEPPSLPHGPYRVIAADPPWRYGNRVEDHTHRGRNQYPDMSVEEICALPVRGLAHDDCVLWLWTTNAFMREAFSVLDAWGFTAKTILTWDKRLLGLGDWLRNVTEHCILAVRGSPLVQLTNQTTLISEARREHSRKPDAFYGLVDSLCPGNKLEMFSREPRPGWDRWGAESEHFAA